MNDQPPQGESTLRKIVPIFWVVLLAVATSCSEGKPRLKLATTTSFENSGLLRELLPQLEKACDCRLHCVAVGTGQALKLGAHGDVDLLVVHAPTSEKAFIEEGHGVSRTTFMQNDFVIVGPQSDPAGIKGMNDGSQALVKIRETQALFISRGDDSGTHKRELAFWSTLDIKPEGAWYLEAGQGMGAVLTLADNKEAYTLTDRGTYLAHHGGDGLAVLVEGDPVFLNPYSAIVVHPDRHPHTHKDLAQKLIDYLCSEQGQKFIGDFKSHGYQLFTPIGCTTE